MQRTRRPFLLCFIALILAGSLTAQNKAASPDGIKGKKRRCTTDRVFSGTVLIRKALALLPVGRALDGLEALVPGAMAERIVGGLSIAGASGGENLYALDGQSVTSLFGGANLQPVVLDFVDEVHVKPAGFQAEHSGALGGVVRVVTRSGGDDLHGELAGYYSGSALRGRERDTTILDPSRSRPTLLTFNYEKRGQAVRDSRLEAGFGIGGPLLRDRLWFYAAAMPVLSRTTQPVIFLHPATAAYEASRPYGDSPLIHAYDFSRRDRELNRMCKLTSRPLDNVRMTMSYVSGGRAFQAELPNRDGSSSDAIDYSALGYSHPNWTLSGSADLAVGDALRIFARVGYHYSGTRNNLEEAAANTSREPLFYFQAGNEEIAQYPDAQRRPTGWQSRSEQSMTYGDYFKMAESDFSSGADLTWLMSLLGEHAWKAGIAFTRAGVDRNTLWNAPQVVFTAFRASDGRASVSVNGGPFSPPDTVNGNAVGQFGDFAVGASRRLALYLQDSWTIARRVTLNFGVRLESETVPSFNDDPQWSDYFGQDLLRFGLFDKVAPRLGFVWEAGGAVRLRIFGSYGICFDEVNMDLAMRIAGGSRWVQDRYYLPGVAAARLFDIGRLADGRRDYSMLQWRGYREYRYQIWENIDPALKPISQREFTAGVEKALNDELTLSVRGTWRSLVRAIEDILIPSPQLNSEIIFLVNPGEGFSLPYSQGGKLWDGYWPFPKAERDFKALDLALEKRMGGNWLGGILLSVSRLHGNYTGIVSGDEAVASNGEGLVGDHMTRYFDKWWMNYKSNGKQELTNGPLPSDRPIVLKAYGTWVSPWGLTFGGVANWMSGTPRSTEFYIDQVPGYYPLGRNDLGRTPSLWFLNLYAEYSLKLGRNSLRFSVTVDNVTNNDTATWYYTCINNRSCYTYWEYPGVSNLSGGYGMGEATTALIKHGYDLFAYEGSWPQDQSHWTRDPRYNKPIRYQAPITARLGVKFVF